MALSWNTKEDDGQQAKVKPGERLWKTRDGERLVPEGHPDAYQLFCTEHGEVPRKEFERYGKKEAKKYEDKSASVDDEDNGTSDEWTLSMSPDDYLARFPDGPNAELARKLVES